MRRSPWSARLAITAVALVALPFATAVPAVGRTAPVSGALAKPSAFLLAPPWANNVSHTVVSDYGTLKHKRTNDPLHANDYYAVDFDMQAGEKVYAAAAGTVAFAGPATGGWATYGIVVYVVHPNGYRTLYAHLSKALVKAGRAITTSTVIGLAGRTGGWPSVHLHFALYRGSKFTGGPYGGQAVVPEPFRPCVKTATAAGPLGLPGRCENLKRGDVLVRGSGGPTAPPPAATPTLPLPTPTPTPAPAAALVNGDFESPTANDLWQTMPTTFGGWEVLGAGVDLVRTEFIAAAHGQQSVDPNSTAPGGVEQAVALPAGAHQLVFELSGNPDPNCGPPGVKRLLILIDGVQAGSLGLDTTGHTLQDPGWVSRVVPFTSTLPSTVIEFLSDTPSTCAGPMIDFVRVQ